MAKAASRLPLIAEASVWSEVSPREICGWQSVRHSDRGSSEYFSFSVSMISPMSDTLSSITDVTLSWQVTATIYEQTARSVAPRVR